VKDRAALGVITNAEKLGLYVLSDVVIRIHTYAAGNTGIGLAHVCRDRGYKCVIFMPNTQVRIPVSSFYGSCLTRRRRVRKRSIS
jgi:cysteine synthase A